MGAFYRKLARRSATSAAMSFTYDDKNVFAKILRGEAPCARIYEDEIALAFMDIMPRTPGHAVVIPKFAARNLLDIPPAELARFIPVVQKVAIAAKAAMGAEGVAIMQFSEAASGQTVFHLHFHILPHWADTPLKPPGGPIEKSEVLAAHAAKIAAALAP
jgi:histidine triad (HIT) family protein